MRLDKRELLACKQCEREVAQAPIGDKVISGGIYGSRLVGHLVIGKYWDSQPLNRLGQGLERLGLAMPSSSMADQIHWATDLLRPIWWSLQDVVLKARVMHLDGTGLPVRDEDSPRGIVTGTLWGYVGVDDAVHAVYLYTSTGKKVGQRKGEVGPEDFLRGRTGYTVADAASIFDLSFQRAGLIEIGCNMHARRYFVKALEAGDTRAAGPLAAFQALYAVEEAVGDADVLPRLARGPIVVARDIPPMLPAAWKKARTTS